MAAPFRPHLPGQTPEPEHDARASVPSMEADGDPFFHFPVETETVEKTTEQADKTPGLYTAADEALGRAFGPWVRGEFPDAKNIGEVVDILRTRATKERDG